MYHFKHHKKYVYFMKSIINDGESVPERNANVGATPFSTILQYRIKSLRPIINKQAVWFYGISAW